MHFRTYEIVKSATYGYLLQLRDVGRAVSAVTVIDTTVRMGTVHLSGINQAYEGDRLTWANWDFIRISRIDPRRFKYALLG